MEQQPQVYRFAWQGVDFETIYSPRKWNVIAHLEIRSMEPEGAPLPISSEGWRSYFHPIGTIEARGGDVVAQVTAWLDEEAAKPEWHAHAECYKQGELL